MDTYRVTLTGTQPLLLHHDDIEWADRMSEWGTNPDNKKNSKAGDDRTPAFRWIGCLYRDEEGRLIMPTENIMRCIMEGGAKVPTGQRQGTFKSQSQSGIMPQALGWPIVVNGKTVPVAPIDELMKVRNFDAHKEAVKSMGFSLFVKRARIGQSKHIRVRPRFETWQVSGDLVVTDESISERILKSILDVAGRLKGLGDWRPGSKTPGPFGMFTAGLVKL